jgi:hypothetical protein
MSSVANDTNVKAMKAWTLDAIVSKERAVLQGYSELLSSLSAAIADATNVSHDMVRDAILSYLSKSGLPSPKSTVKRPLSSYFLFGMEHRAAITETLTNEYGDKYPTKESLNEAIENGTAFTLNSAILKALAAKWNAMTDEEKAPYVAKAKAAKDAAVATSKKPAAKAVAKPVVAAAANEAVSGGGSDLPPAPLPAASTKPKATTTTTKKTAAAKTAVVTPVAATVAAEKTEKTEKTAAVVAKTVATTVVKAPEPAPVAAPVVAPEVKKTATAKFVNGKKRTTKKVDGNWRVVIGDEVTNLVVLSNQDPKSMVVKGTVRNGTFSETLTTAELSTALAAGLTLSPPVQKNHPRFGVEDEEEDEEASEDDDDNSDAYSEDSDGDDE